MLKKILLLLIFIQSTYGGFAAVFKIPNGDVAGLITAITIANSNNQPDTIILALMGKYSLRNPIASTFPIDGSNGLPDIILDGNLSNKIVIWGNGSIIERDTTVSDFFRIIMNHYGALELNDLVIKNGKLDGSRNGAGIYNYAELTIYNSTLVNNKGGFLGGALSASLNANTYLTNCTITGNAATTGAAAYFYMGNGMFTHCTVSDNYCIGNNGAAIQNVLTVDNVAFQIYLKQTIVASNKSTDGNNFDIGGVIKTAGQNFIGNNSEINAHIYITAGVPNNVGDYVGTNTSPLDPLLGLLKYNGGLTPTMEILSTASLAFNNGGQAAFSLATDQAGNNRLGNVEIGSLEFNNNSILNPGLNIKQGTLNIPSLSGLYAFGNVLLNQKSDSIVFIIQNTGFFQKLRLLGTPFITISGPDSLSFIVKSDTTKTAINGNGQTGFTIIFCPSSTGIKNGIISIASNDTNEPIYTFHITGNGITLPVITLDPSDENICTGEAAMFYVNASGSNVQYHWRKNGVFLSDGGNITGSQTTNLTISNASSSDEGTYDCMINDVYTHTVTSNSSTLALKPIPVITSQPSAVSKSPGESVTFTLTATGTGLSYQWRKDNVNLNDQSNISGSNTTSLTLSAVDILDAGNYSCVITDQCNISIVSIDAILSVSTITPIVTNLHNTITVYPNPVTDQIHLGGISEGDHQVVLTNIYGNVVKEFHLDTNTNYLTMEDIAPGAYLLHLKKDGYVIFTTQIIKF